MSLILNEWCCYHWHGIYERASSAGKTWIDYEAKEYKFNGKMADPRRFMGLPPIYYRG